MKTTTNVARACENNFSANGDGGGEAKTYALQTHYIESNINMLNAFLSLSARLVAKKAGPDRAKSTGLAYVLLKYYRLKVLIVPPQSA